MERKIRTSVMMKNMTSIRYCMIVMGLFPCMVGPNRVEFGSTMT